jgi:hypothetical protein
MNNKIKCISLNINMNKLKSGDEDNKVELVQKVHKIKLKTSNAVRKTIAN